MYRNLKIVIIVSPAIKVQSVKSLAGLTLEGGDMLDHDIYPHQCFATKYLDINDSPSTLATKRSTGVITEMYIRKYVCQICLGQVKIRNHHPLSKIGESVSPGKNMYPSICFFFSVFHLLRHQLYPDPSASEICWPQI